MPRTLKQLAQEAIDVQSACNLSGVVHSFSRLITELREALEKEPGFGTNTLNTHPIVQAYVDKLASLCGTQLDDAAAGKAHGWCMDLVEAPDPAPDPYALPDVARRSVQRQYGDKSSEILERVKYDCSMGCWFFWDGPVYVGIEKDGYIHT